MNPLIEELKEYCKVCGSKHNQSNLCFSCPYNTFFQYNDVECILDKSGLCGTSQHYCGIPHTERRTKCLAFQTKRMFWDSLFYEMRY
jgi:hypothetical protein